jgi:penicillin-binding protein 1A
MKIRYYFYKTIHVTLFMGLLITLLAAVTSAAIQWYFIPQLPTAESLKDIRLQTPFRVYSHDGLFIAEYGEQRRLPLALHEIPPLMIQAVLSAEDDRFYTHSGVDMKGLLRAVVTLMKTGEKRQGGSTITMQVARNFFLSHERTFSRKFSEILLAFKIEEELSKDDILELYLNKIFFGHRAYGVGAAAEVYFGKPLKNLTVPEFALLAGLPKAPSTSNPLANPEKAIERRNYILGRMQELGFLDTPTYEDAIKAPLTANLHRLAPEMEGLYIAELVRSELLSQFKEDDIYTNGYKVYTTIASQLQNRAQTALRSALFYYDRRRGYRGPFAEVEIPKNLKGSQLTEYAHNLLDKYPTLGGLIPSLVLSTSTRTIVAYNQKGGLIKVDWQDMAWARGYRRNRYAKSAGGIAKRGDIILVRPMLEEQQQFVKQKKQFLTLETIDQEKYKHVRWRLYQVPKVEGALVAIDPTDGAIIALAGGFDFNKSKFNRVTQAQRQPGSTFKPFIYSAALERGFSDYSTINDAPVTFRVGGRLWRPENFSHHYYGPTSLRTALALSHNVSAVKLLHAVGVRNAINHVVKFGFDRDRIPKNLTIALGTGEITPLELTRGFAVFANGGYRINPYFIDRIEDASGRIVFSTNALKVCRQCDDRIIASEKEEVKGMVVSHSVCTPNPRYAPRIISARNAQLMNSMLKDVIRRGTAKKARELGRSDLAGKTGTTSNLRDAWFAGYSPNLVAISWIGFDKPRSLGQKETGGHTALPMWMDFMRFALRNQPSKTPPTDNGNRERYYITERNDFDALPITTDEVDAKPNESTKEVKTTKAPARKRQFVSENKSASGIRDVKGERVIRKINENKEVKRKNNAELNQKKYVKRDSKEATTRYNNNRRYTPTRESNSRSNSKPAVRNSNVRRQSVTRESSNPKPNRSSNRSSDRMAKRNSGNSSGSSQSKVIPEQLF